MESNRDWPALCRRIAEALEPNPMVFSTLVHYNPHGGKTNLGLISSGGLWSQCVFDHRIRARNYWFDHSAALALVEAMNREGWDISVDHLSSGHVWVDMYNVEEPGNTYLRVPETEDRESAELRYTFCEAICLAVARALGVE